MYQGFQVARGKESACQCRRHKRCKFDPWVGKIPWRREWQLTPVILAWKIPRTEEPGGLHSMGCQRVRHNWAYTHTSDVGTSYHLNENLESKPMLLHFNKALMVIPMHGQIWELYPIWAHEPDHIYDLKTLEGEMFVVLSLASWLWNTHTVNDIPWVWKNAYTSRSAHALRII